LKPPVTLKSPEEIEAWKEKEYKRKAGPFHKVDWHRIILDGVHMALLRTHSFLLILTRLAEAHVIKNKDCATSIAVRALRGKFKWVVSGTPLHK
jgi:SNF2 family DNA or RNA helicase